MARGSLGSNLGYRSDTTIIVSPSRSSRLASLGGGEEGEEVLSLLPSVSLTGSVDLYIGILKSRRIAQQVVERFHLCEYYEAEDVQEAVEKLQKDTQIEVTKEGFLRVITTLKGTPRLGRLLEVFQGKLAQERDRPVREQVAAMANFYITAMQEYIHETQLDTARAQRKFLEKQVEKARRDQELAYLRLQRFQEKKGHVSLSDELRAALDTYSKLRSESLLAQSKVEELQTQIEEVRSRLRRQMQDPAQLPAHAPLLADLRRKLNDLQYEYRTKAEDMAPAHPEMQRLRVQIQQTQQDLATETAKVLQAIEQGTAPELQDLEVQKSAAEAQVAALKTQLQRFEEQWETVPEDQKDLAQLTLETKVQSDLYSLLVTQWKQAEIAEHQEGELFHVLDEAIPPVKHASPRLAVNLVGGSLLSLVLGICLAFGVEFIRSSGPRVPACSTTPTVRSSEL
jgi:uncharacterized protein involved in exopolysaccharide biosynthesis